MPPGLRVAGAALALSTPAGAAWLLWATAENGRPFVRLGVAGLLAIGLLWSAGARSAGRAAACAAVLGAVLLLGAAGVIVMATALSLGQDPFGGVTFDAALVDGRRDGTFGPVSEYEYVSFAITYEMALSWALTVVGIVSGIAVAPALQRRVHSRRAVAALPFAVLAVAALFARAEVAAIAAMCAGLWLTVAVRALGHAGAPAARPEA